MVIKLGKDKANNLKRKSLKNFLMLIILTKKRDSICWLLKTKTSSSFLTEIESKFGKILRVSIS